MSRGVSQSSQSAVVVVGNYLPTSSRPDSHDRTARAVSSVETSHPECSVSLVISELLSYADVTTRRWCSLQRS